VQLLRKRRDELGSFARSLHPADRTPQETFDTGDPATADQHVQTGHSFRSLVADTEKGTKLHWIRGTGVTASKPTTLRSKDGG
jgi:hypothetical protein